MIGWVVRVFGCFWPADTPPPTPPACDNAADNIPADIPPVPVRRPPWLSPSRQGLPCPECGLGLVDGECLACTAGWTVA